MRTFCAGALVTVVPIALNGCGSSGPSPSPSPSPSDASTTVPTTTKTTSTPPVDEACADNQGQCSRCLQGICLSCKDGYLLENSTVSGGTCVASCSNTTMNPPKPSNPNDFSGSAWPQMCLSSKTTAHFFGIGDWGGDSGGHTWNNPGVTPRHGGFKNGPDDYGQYYVARQMKDLASRSEVDPDFVLNAGDNFYPGGYNLYPDHCGPQQANEDDPKGVFQSTFDAIYGGPGMDGKPWLGILGNHDYGGYSMSMGWDQVIFHSWHSNTWRTPAPYWSQRVQYKDFAAQFIFLDSNFYDVGVDHWHNICQEGLGYCWGIDSDESCANWFNAQWSEGIKMAEAILKESTAEWHIVVTHYPTAFRNKDIKHLHDRYGIDVMFTGHNHLQALTQTEDGMVTITSGGGGGITTDYGVVDLLSGDDDALGFVDFEISRTELKINMHSWGGCTSCDGTEGPADQLIRHTTTISPHGSSPAPAPPSPSPGPAPLPGGQCCFGAYAGGCDDYHGSGGLCNNNWAISCVNDRDCNGALFV